MDIILYNIIIGLSTFLIGYFLVQFQPELYSVNSFITKIHVLKARKIQVELMSEDSLEKRWVSPSLFWI